MNSEMQVAPVAVSILDPRNEEIDEVLVVEDDAGDALLAEEHISEQSNGTVRTVRASTVAEAIASVTPRTSCVLLDLNLPDADGISALTALLDSLPGLPIVVLTGVGGRTAGLAALNAGAQDYLDKNELTGSALWRSIRFAVERRHNVDRERALLEAGLRREENRRLARGLLPTPRLHHPNLRWASRYAPASAGSLLGGDFIDAVELDDGTVRAVIGDVCGHGPEEAAVGACLRIGWRTLVLAGFGQTATLDQLERLFDAERHDPTLFTTVCDVLIDPAHRTVSVALAGHEPPLLISDGVVGQLEVQPGPLLGLGLGTSTPTTVALPERWTLVLFTDGIIEGRVNGGSERLGVPALCRVFAGHLPATDTDLLDAVVSTVELVHGGPLPDDLAVFMLSDRGTLA